jgi:arylsulfatase A-like enzyme
MMGEADKKIAHDFESPIDLEKACRIADAQLGRVLDELAAEKLTEHTMIISTADHGGQSDLKYFGNGAGEIVGKLVNSNEGAVPFWAQHLDNTGLVRLSCFDTGFRVWLKEPNKKNTDEALKVMRTISGVTHIFALDHSKNAYHEVYKDFSNVGEKFKTWATAHDLELANTMAAARGPDLIAFFEDNVGFDRIGDHGGAQEKVQRIPMLIAVPGGPRGVSAKALRLVDLKSVIKENLNLKN